VPSEKGLFAIIALVIIVTLATLAFFDFRKKNQKLRK